jgi:hypothetical protein
MTREHSTVERGGFRPAARALLLACLALAACERAPAPAIPAARPLDVATSLSTNVIRIGDLCDWTVTVVHPDDSEVYVPDPSKERAILVRTRATDDTTLEDGHILTTIRHTISSLEPGTYDLVTNALRCVRSDGTVLEAALPRDTLMVRSVLQDENESLRENKGLATWPGAIPRWLMVLLAALLLIGTALFAIRRALTRPRTILHHPPPPPPHETALRALRALRAEGWIEQGHVEPFYVQLSGIVRRYLEDRFGLHAPERTTEEFIRDATTSGHLVQAHQALTIEFLEQSDLVKFARHRPGTGEMEAAYAAAERLVRETMGEAGDTDPGSEVEGQQAEGGDGV